MLDLSPFFQEVETRRSAQGSQDQAKRAAAEAALALVEPGMKLGLGTGSTVEFFLQGLAARMREGFEVLGGVPTSKATETRCRELGIPLLGGPHYHDLRTDLCVDGADRVDAGGCLIKGGGGALLREKLVASYSKRVCIMVDPGKIRNVFDDSFAVPVECVAFGLSNIRASLQGMGCRASVRTNPAGDAPYTTDNGNMVIDCKFAQIPDPVALALGMGALTGVVEVGIFTNLLDHLAVGFSDGTHLTWSRSPAGAGV